MIAFTEVYPSSQVVGSTLGLSYGVYKFSLKHVDSV